MKLLTASSAMLLLALALTSVPASAQNWLRGESDPVHDARLLARPDGTLVDLGLDDAFDTTQLRVHDHEGETLAAVRLDTVFGGSGEALDMALLADGDVVVVGEHREDDNSSWSPFIGRFDPATGLSDWLVRVPWFKYSYDRVLVDGDAVYVIGRGELETIVTVARYDASGGVAWGRYFSVHNEDLDLRDVCLAPGGGVVIAMRDSSSNTHLVAMDATGSQAWHNYYDVFDAEAVGRTAGGDVWVGGESDAGQLAVLAFSASGAQLWAKEYLGFPVSAKHLLPTDDGGAVVTVTRDLGGAYQPSMIALDASGAVAWSRMYDIGNGYAFQGAIEAVDVGERGFILRGQTEADNHLLAVDRDGSCDLPCVGVTDLATLVQASTISKDEPLESYLYTFTPSPEGWLLQPYLITNGIELECGDPCSATTSSLGEGLAGSGAIVPELTGTSGACIGAPRPRIELSKGLGGTIGVFGYAFGSTSLPAFGGTLYLDPQTLKALPIVLDGPAGAAGMGTWGFEVQTELVSFIGVPIVTQAALYDPAAVAGWSFTAALSLIAE